MMGPSPSPLPRPCASAVSWAERAAEDSSLRTFVEAEIARAGIELDTLRWQRTQQQARIDNLIRQLDERDRELAYLRRRVPTTRRTA